MLACSELRGAETVRSFRPDAPALLFEVIVDILRHQHAASPLFLISGVDSPAGVCYIIISTKTQARLVKLADTKDLGSFAVRHAGSSPAPRTSF